MIRVTRTTKPTQMIADLVAAFASRTNLARLLTVRTKFIDLVQLAYLKRTNFGLAVDGVQMYHCIV